MGRPALVMFCGSAHGASIWLDGEEVARGNIDARMTDGTAAGQWYWHYASRINIGMSGVLATDLGLAENAGYRRRMEAFLLGKYGIS